MSKRDPIITAAADTDGVPPDFECAVNTLVSSLKKSDGQCGAASGLLHNTIAFGASGDAPGSAHEGTGHRTRLIDRFAENGIASLHQHEILELLLTFIIRQKDTKSTARALLKYYKSISAVCNAPIEELQQFEGVGKKSALLLSFVRDLLAVCLKEKFERGSVVANRHDVEVYLQFMYGYRRDEFVTAVFLDTANHILSTEVIAEGTVNQCVLYPRIIIEKALRCRAAAMLIAHNHPGGTTQPSENDWQITERLYRVGKLLDLPLIDHIIICRESVISLLDMPRWPGNAAGRE